jgi:hypothetical protein
MKNFLMTLPEDVARCLTEMVNQEMRAGGKYDPFDADNFDEAMREAKEPQFAQLAALARANEHEAVTAALHLITREYWFDFACRAMAHKAEEEIAEAEDYNPAAIEPWERKLPAILERQAEW